VPREKFDVVTKVCSYCLLNIPHCMLLLHLPKFCIICLSHQACQCPVYWKIPLFIAAGGDKLGYVEANTFIDFWKK